MHCTIAIPKFKDGLFRKYMQSKYTASLRRAGAKAVWIETDDLDKAIQEMLLCDGLLLSGGEDVNPTYYGQTATEKCGKIVPARDHAEMKMLEAFLSTGKPILGICRGEQLMNVYFGGTLYQDIPSQCPSDVAHRMAPPDHRTCHNCIVTPGSPLQTLTGRDTIDVNSHHHQSVKDVAPGFEVMGRCEDGIIESIYDPRKKFVWGVQWHPEKIWDIEESSAQLFQAFIEACK